MHSETTSCSVNGASLPAERSNEKGEQEKEEEEAIAITSGSSRDHRADLTPWMLGLASTHDGDLPIVMRPLDGKSGDKERLSAMVSRVMAPWRETVSEEQEERLLVFESGGDREATVKPYNEEHRLWMSRVPETSTDAQAAVGEEATAWQALSDGSGEDRRTLMDLPQGKERWGIVRTKAAEQAARLHREKTVKKAKEQGEKQLWHLCTQECACQQDADVAWTKAMKGNPAVLRARWTSQEKGHAEHKGRPNKGATPASTVWHGVAPLTIDPPDVEAQITRHASCLVAPTVIDEQKRSHDHVSLTSKEQGGVERGFRFLNDPLFLASSVFLKKPERLMALRCIMGACVLVSRFAEHHLRRHRASTSQTVPNHVNTPPDRPPMRWMFQCVEGSDLLPVRAGFQEHVQVLGRQHFHQNILLFLGSASCHISCFSPYTAECGL